MLFRVLRGQETPLQLFQGWEDGCGTMCWTGPLADGVEGKDGWRRGGHR